MIITFAGHGSVSAKGYVKEKVKEQIRNIIVDVDTVVCYLGGYGDFDKICAEACRELKSENLGIEIVYVTPYLNLTEQKKIEVFLSMGLYDSCIYPPIESIPPRFAISKRNEWMMAVSDFVIAYVNHKYGGAYKSLLFAKRRNKNLINICDLI